MFKLSERSIANRTGVRSELAEIADLAIQLSLVDFGHPEYAGGRDLKDQQHLYSIGASKADGIINKSDHQIDEAKPESDAIDFFAYVDGKASWEDGHLALVACAFYEAASRLGYRISWGGLWKDFKDAPHITFKGEY